jgi:hypothetical protein
MNNNNNSSTSCKGIPPTPVISIKVALSDHRECKQCSILLDTDLPEIALQYVKYLSETMLPSSYNVFTSKMVNLTL